MKKQDHEGIMENTKHAHRRVEMHKNKAVSGPW